MIVLDVENYCHGCPMFEGEQDGVDLRDMKGNVVTDQYIRCSHRQQCKRIYNFLKGEIQTNGL